MPSASRNNLKSITRQAPLLASALVVGANLLVVGQAAAIAGLISDWLGGDIALSAPLAAALFVVLGLARAGLGYLAEGLLFEHSEGVIAGLRAHLVRAQALRAWRGDQGSGALASLAGEKLDLLGPYLTRYEPAQLRAFTVPLIILLIAFSISWAAGLILLVAGPLIPVFMALVGLAARDASVKHMSELGTISSVLGEYLSALVDIRVLNAGEAVVDGFAARTDSLRKRVMAVLRIAFLSSTVLELFSAIGVAMMAVYVGFSLLGIITFGTYGTPVSPFAGIFLLVLAPEFFQPLRDHSGAWHDKASADAVADEYVAWQGEESPNILGQGCDVSGPESGTEIVTKGLAIELPGGHRIAYPDLDIRPGMAIAITGPSGAGKSTLLSLISGLVPASEGEIHVGGQLLADSNADAWRARMAFVPQTMRFLNASLKWNIALTGQPDIERLNGALEQAAVRDVVERAPRGLETRLGENGAGLSGGEARRIAIARAIYSGADVVLADEPTADLDEASAKLVSEGLMALKQSGVILIVATHDAALAKRMDQAIDLGGGQ